MEDGSVAEESKPKFDPEAFLAKADGGVTISKYGKGQVVFAQGDPVDSVFYIREGRVKISVVSAQGKEAVVAFLKAGDFIGEGCCLTGRPRRIASLNRGTSGRTSERVVVVTANARTLPVLMYSTVEATSTKRSRVAWICRSGHNHLGSDWTLPWGLSLSFVGVVLTTIYLWSVR
jgi:CRP-like cAMP-binding protein